MISIIIPMYNARRHIKKAIDSAMAQNVSKEIIVVDDCSTDSSYEYVAELAREYNGASENIIRVYKNEKNSGAAVTRNNAISYSTGQYIALLDADDWWEPDKLEKQLYVLENSECSLCCTDRAIFSEDGVARGKLIKSPETIDYKLLLKSNWINCSSVMIKRDVIREFAFEDGAFHEDYLLWLRIVKKYGAARNICEPLLCYRSYSKSKSGNKLKSMYMTYLTYRENGDNVPKAIYRLVFYIFYGLKKH